MINKPILDQQIDLIAEDNSEENFHLPAAFFAELLDLPACKQYGFCDNCGKCEH